jgi:hypothetical protein
MSKLIIYFSLAGHNRDLANELAEKEKSDIIEFAPGGKLRVFQFFSRRSLAKRAKKIDTTKYKDLVIFGPIWAGKPAPAFMALLQNLEIAGKKIECNITHTGNFGETENLVKNIISERNGTVKNINLTKIEEKSRE